MAEPLLSAASPHLIIAFAWKSSEFLRQELEQGFCCLVSATMMPDDVSGDFLKNTKQFGAMELCSGGERERANER